MHTLIKVCYNHYLFHKQHGYKAVVSDLTKVMQEATDKIRKRSVTGEVY